VFNFFQRRRRARLRAEPFPERWREYLRDNVGWYTLLSGPEQAKLEGDLRIFLAEKYWEGCAGLALTDEIKVTIAGQASLLSLAWTDYFFERVQTILVYPSAYRARGRAEFGQSLPTERVGEALDGGPVVLSWRDSLADARGTRDGRNVVLHEFAHVIDMENGDSDGIPSLGSRRAERLWQATLEEAMRTPLPRGPALLEAYAYQSPAEFFAVSTEAFFERGALFRHCLPEFYRLMADFYRQDPASRSPSTDQGDVFGEAPIR
jgi:Mlc titration factor MtfA (ptsG expression regulator)